MSRRTDADRRSESRERRRSAAQDDGAQQQADGNDASDGTARESAGQAARAAAAAAAVGAVLGAVRAVAARSDEDDDSSERQSREAATQPEPHDTETPDDDAGETDEQRAAQTQAPEDDTPEQPRDRRADHSHDDSPREGASSGTVRSIVARAREQLRDLQGRDAESVTALERIGDGWRITCEVVEVERIPNSTDVLATYVVELDGDGELLQYERVRRYYRAQSDVGGER